LISGRASRLSDMNLAGMSEHDVVVIGGDAIIDGTLTIGS
jgi:hypothetical protein